MKRFAKLPLLVAGGVLAALVLSGYYDQLDKCVGSSVFGEGSIVLSEPQLWPPGSVRCRAEYPREDLVLTETFPKLGTYLLYLCFSLGIGAVVALGQRTRRVASAPPQGGPRGAAWNALLRASFAALMVTLGASAILLVSGPPGWFLSTMCAAALVIVLRARPATRQSRGKR